MNLEKYSHIIFDFDNTLVTLEIEWSHWHVEIINLIKSFEPDFDEKTYLNMHSIHHYIIKYGKDFRDKFVEFEKQMEQKHYKGFIKIEKSLALLKKFHAQNKNLYLLTSNTREIVEPILDELEIKSFFKKTVTINDVANLKPSVAPWGLIANLDADKTKYLMVGDSAPDSGFAKSVGIDYLDVTEIDI